MSTPFTAKAFTPPVPGDWGTVVRAILQLQQAFGGTGTVPQNNLNVLQNKIPPNTVVFSASTLPAGSSASSNAGAVTVLMGGYFF